MTQDLLPPSSGSCPAPDDAVERGARAITLPILAVVAGMLGSIALLIGLVARLEPARERPLPTVLVERGGRGAELPALTYSPMATAITPITSSSITAAPSELGGSVTGSLYASADRVDIYARTSSGSGTLNLIEWVPEASRWAIYGADCSVGTDLKPCRYTTKRGARYWHVLRSSGTMATVLIDQAYNQSAGLGGIEPTTAAISLPLSVDNGGTALTSYTAGDLLYASGTTTLAKLGIGASGYVLTSNGTAPTWAAAASGGGNCTILATVWDGGITTAGKFPAFDGVQWGAATAGNAIRRVLPAGSTWKIRAAITGAPGSGNTVKFEIQTSASLGGTFSADAASAVTFTNSDGANAIKTGSTFTVGGSAVIATIRAIATGADYVSPNQASVQLDCG